MGAILNTFPRDVGHHSGSRTNSHYLWEDRALELHPGQRRWVTRLIYISSHSPLLQTRLLRLPFSAGVQNRQEMFGRKPSGCRKQEKGWTVSRPWLVDARLQLQESQVQTELRAWMWKCDRYGHNQISVPEKPWCWESVRQMCLSSGKGHMTWGSARDQQTGCCPPTCWWPSLLWRGREPCSAPWAPLCPLAPLREDSGT